MDIDKSNNNFKDRKPKCFNYNKYSHIAKECWNKKKEKETRKCFKCDKEMLELRIIDLVSILFYFIFLLFSLIFIEE